MDSNSIMQKITEEFIVETYELLDIISGSILDLEKTNDVELVNSIYRAFHTIKGNAYLAGFTDIGELAHKLEDVLSIVKSGGIEVNSELVDYYLNSTDTIKIMTERIESGDETPVDISSLLKVFDNITACAYQADLAGLQQEDTLPADLQPEEEIAEGIEVECDDQEQDGTHVFGDKSKTDDFLGSLAKDSFRPLRILVVEDDFTSRQLMVTALSRYGDCHVAKDGLEAVQAVIESYEKTPTVPYDLICMDVQMPNMDGTVASKTIREIERGKDIEGTEFESVIIMISCVEDPKVIMKACYQCGANHYFVKPLDLNQMTRQMQKLGLITLEQSCTSGS